jgi:uncharacterized protein (DUF2461 family)
MTGRDKLNELATARGLSERTARRYLKAGVDLNDPSAVEEHKQKLRARRGVSKFWHRATVPPELPEQRYVDQLEDIIWSVHMTLAPLRLKHPEIAEDLRPILNRTRPVIEKITEEL